MHDHDPARDDAGRADFVGRGVAFPLAIDGAGRIALLSGDADIDRSLRSIILTAPGERLMRPAFGCAIWDLLFHPSNHNTLGLMRHAVREAVGRWEPRVELDAVDVTLAEHGTKVVIDLVYRIRSTNDRRNLVFPFYTIVAEEP
jgi:phage baseplate assembly protein W